MAKAVRSSGNKIAAPKKKTVAKAKVAGPVKAKSTATPVSKTAAVKASVVAPKKKGTIAATPVSAAKKKTTAKVKVVVKAKSVTSPKAAGKSKSSIKTLIAIPKVAVKKSAVAVVAPAVKKAAAKKAVSKKAKIVREKAVAKEITVAKKDKAKNGIAKNEKAAEVKAQPIAVHPAAPSKKISKILITQPKPDTDKSPYFELAKKHNIQLQFHPFIRVEGLSGKDFRKQRVDIAEFTAIVFTSRSAVDHFFRICEEMKIKVSQDMKYCCITEAVALYLQKFILYRKRKVFFSADGSVHGLLDVIGKHKNEKYLLPVADSGKNDIHHYFAKHNITFAEVTLYKTVSNEIGPIMQADFDMIVFFSPFSVNALFAHDPKFKQNGTLIGAFGPTTSKAVEDAGLRLDVKAPAPNAPSMVSALEQFLDVKKK